LFIVTGAESEDQKPVQRHGRRYYTSFEAVLIVDV